MGRVAAAQLGAIALAVAWSCTALEALEINLNNSATRPDDVDGPWPAVEILYNDGQNALQLYPTFLNASVLIRPQRCGDDLTNNTYRCSEITYPAFYETNHTTPTETFYNRAANDARPWNNTTDFFWNSANHDVSDVIVLDGGKYSLEDVNISVQAVDVRMPSYVITNPVVPLSNISHETPLLTGLLSLPILAANLTVTDRIPSEFFSLHAGSVEPLVPGSLIIGGYDNNRILGNLVDGGQSQNGWWQTGSASRVAITNINIGVEEGFLPLDSLKMKDNSYPQGPYKQDPGQRYSGYASASDNIMLDPGAPYFHLGSRFCQPLAEMLSLQYDATRNLYLWTNSPDDPIFRSPTFLEFELIGLSLEEGFVYHDSDNESTKPTVSIKIPLAQLQHTFHSSTIAANGTILPPARYFPCSNSEMDAYPYRDPFRLGRPFFQAAFVAANMHYGDKPETLAEFWLAQAPGPDYIAQRGKDIRTVDSNGTIPNRTNEPLEPNAWTRSWSSVLPIWTIDTDGRTLAEVTAVHPDDETSRSKRLGLEVGVPIAGVIVLTVAFYYIVMGCKRSRAKWRAIRKQIAEEDATALEIERLLRSDPEKDSVATHQEFTNYDDGHQIHTAAATNEHGRSVSEGEASIHLLPLATRHRGGSVSSVSEMSDYGDVRDDSVSVPEEHGRQGFNSTYNEMSDPTDIAAREEAVRIWQRVSSLADDDLMEVHLR